MSLATSASSDAQSFPKRMLSFVQNPQVVKTALIGAGAGIIAASSISLLTGASLALTGVFAWSIVGSIVAVAARSIHQYVKSLEHPPEIEALHVTRRSSEETFNQGVDAWATQATSEDLENRENIQTAKIRIKECYRESSKELNLSFCRLKSLPAEIRELTNLNSLILGGNQLKALPEEIVKLTSLQVLFLSENQLEALPEEIGKLTSLQVLFLSENQLEALPEEIGKLTSLVWLNLSKNQLEALPEEIGKLTSLKTLDLSENKVGALPKEIDQLTSLETLFLSRNQLRALPEEIDQLTSLKELYLNQNQLNSLPLGIFNLPEGCKIYIESNPFTEATIRRLQDVANAHEYNGPRFRFNMVQENLDFDHDIGPTLEKIEALTEIKLNIAKLQAAIPDESQEAFRTWVNKLFWTADGKSKSDRSKAYFTSVANILNKSNEDESFRDDVFMPCMLQGYESCGDRIALSIIHMSLRKQILETDPKEAKRMSHLLVRGEYALELLEEIATDKIKTLGAVDEVEVHLGFLCRLKEDLKLPINLENMLYFDISYIKEEDLENAKTKVEEKLKLEKAIPDFLVKNPTWHNTLIALKAEEMKEIENEAERAYEVDPGMSADSEMIEKKRGDGIAELTWELLR